ncbi:MAG: glycoside hydrolase family 2 TIM barrel-domain containing protein [Bradymonadia bacterium]
MRALLALLGAVALTGVATGAAWGAPNDVKTVKDEGGWRLMVDGKPTMVFGMNWGYIPIGQNYSWVLWHQPDDVIEDALRREMPLLQGMGVNAIRQYPDIPSKWVTWIYENYGIYTVVNHTLGRYGFSVDGVWVPNTDYSDPATRKAIMADVDAMVSRYKDTRGVLMYMLGNENNYGLVWTSFEAENLPTAAAKDEARAEPLYTLFGESATRIKAVDKHHPVSMANGDMGYVELIAKHCKDIDVFGSNVYRGKSSRDLFDKVDEILDRPFMYTEFGSDAFNARTDQEDANAQAEYLRLQWQEIYEHAHGKGRSGVAIGGMIFQWSDGWWKHKQVENLDVHDNTATWATGAYPHDFVEGQNNMNEEWFGIAAKTFPDDRGVFDVQPRTAYYLLKEAFKLDPYAEDTTPERIKAHFGALKPIDYEADYKADRALALAKDNAKYRISRLELRLESIYSAGDDRTVRDSRTLVDHTQSAFFDITAEPNSDVRGRVSFNVLGDVAQNRLNDIFYENRGRDLRTDPDALPTEETQDLSGLERVAIYQAELEIKQDYYNLKGYYRVGHFHWGDEGDFFGLYPEAYYGPFPDIYNANTPIGFEFEGKKVLDGLKLAFGPEMYWGANPGIIAKYHRKFGGFEFALMHHEDLGTNATSGTSNVIPIRRSRRSSLTFGYSDGGLRIDAGVLASGSDRIGEQFFWTEEVSGRGYRDTGLALYDDEITFLDTLGGKARVTYLGGWWQAYVHGVFKGLVSAAGADPRQRFTGWSLNESGNGNQIGGLAGVAMTFGSFQIAPHMLWQKPLVGPIDPTGDFYSANSGIYYPGMRARNQLDDAFAVLDNRETLGVELLLVWDPTPGTWFWQFDNPIREDAPFAAALDLVYRHQPTTRDARFGVNEDGLFFAFPGAPEAEDVWDVTGRWVANPGGGVRLIGNVFGGKGQSRGVDERLIFRYGADVRLIRLPFDVMLSAAIDDWGPYDFHKDFNQTFPFQGNADFAYVMGMKDLQISRVKFGLRGIFRTLDENSGEYVVDPNNPGALGQEWEVGSYIHLNL